MSEGEIRHPDGRIEHPDVRHEPTDIRFGCILAVIVAACCFAVTHYFLVWRFYGWQKAARKQPKGPYIPAIIPSTQLPPEPRLEQLDRLAGVESSNVFKRLAAEEKVLNSYGPTQENGFIHIPIRQAIKSIASDLPVREESSGRITNDAGLMDSGESNSGRMFRGEP